MKKTKQIIAILLIGLMLPASQPVQAGSLNSDDSTISQVETETTEGTEISADVETESESEQEPVLPAPEGQIPAAGEDNPINYTSLYYIDNHYELNAGAKQKLQVCTVPAGGTVTYESSNPAVASVSPTGEVTAVSGGSTGKDTAIITAAIGELRAECIVAVSNIISLDKSRYTIYTDVQNPYRLTVNSTPTAETVTWTTSDKSVATVNEQGIIVPKKAGTAIITATANGVSASCDVTVKKSSLTLSSKTTIYLENPTALNATASPDAEITWKTSDKKIATVDANGVVTPKKIGKVTISATANGITKNCVVTIQKPVITLSSKKVTIFTDNIWQLQVESKPAVIIKWKSSNSNVAKVDNNGMVTGIKAGTAKITASISGASVECKVVVKKNPYKLSLTKKTMMVGNTSALFVKNLKPGINVNYWLEEDNGCVELSNADGICNIKAKREGTATIYASFYTEIDGATIGWGSQCVVQIINTGISQQEFSLAKGASKVLTIKNAGNATNIKEITWSSTAPSVAGVDAATGKVSGKKVGSAQIKATVTYTDGSVSTFTTKVKISNPKLNVKAAVVALGRRNQVSLKGTNPYSTTKWKTSKSTIATVGTDGTLTAQTSGKTTLKVTVDGKTLSCPVYITNPRLTSGNAVLEPGGAAKISLGGVCKNSKITYKSANEQIATVSKSGTVTANAYGSTQIKINADGMEFSYWVDCAPRAAIDACNTGYNIMYSSTYSQAYRMTPGYYDCSSLIFRSYGYNTALLGGASSWAPTAAGMAQYMEITGKDISYQAVDVSQLRVGDIIFYGGGDNGRYKNIYHVSMYYGGGNRLEKPLCKYYPNNNIVMIARPIK